MWVQEPTGVILCCLPGHVSGSWVRSGAAGIYPHFHSTSPCRDSYLIAPGSAFSVQGPLQIQIEHFKFEIKLFESQLDLGAGIVASGLSQCLGHLHPISNNSFVSNSTSYKYTWETVDEDPSTWILAPMWETLMEFWAPGIGLAQLWLF